MRHAARQVRVRRGRVVAATASALTIGVAVLGSSGILPVSAPTGLAFAAGNPDLSARNEHAADRSKRADPKATPSATPRTAAKNAGNAKPGKHVRPTADPNEKLPANSGHGKRIVYRLDTNHVWLVDASGRVERSYLVSGTKFDQVEPGSYRVMRKRLHTTSYKGDAKMDYMVVFTEGKNAAIGFHDIPIRLADGKPEQSLRQLGQPLSDGCVRQATTDARALWAFGSIGTPVIVLR